MLTHTASSQRAGQGPPTARAQLSGITVVVLAAVVYFVAARLGLLFAIFDDGVSPVWPPAGIVLALALLLGPRVAIGAAIGAFLSDALRDGPRLEGLVVGLGAGVSCGVGWLLLRASRFDPTIASVRDVLRLIVLGAALSPLLSAVNGAAMLWWSGQIGDDTIGTAFLTWWSGDALGVLVFAPLVLAVARRPRARLTRGGLAELATASALLVLVSVAVFGPELPGRIATGALVLFVAPAMIVVWFALRFDQRLASAAMIFVGVVAIWGAAHGGGGFALLAQGDRLWLLQLYLLLCTLTTFSIAGLSADRVTQVARLRESERGLRRTSKLSGVGGFTWRFGEPEPRWSRELHDIFAIPVGAPTIQSRDVASIMEPDDGERYLAIARRMQREPEPFRMTFSFRRKDGALRHAEGIAEPAFDSAGKLVGWDGAIQDITERVEADKRLRQVEARLQQSQRLESLGLLAGSVAHDFNNLLTTISLSVESIKATAGELPDVGEACGDVAHAVEVAAGMCSQMLTFAGRSKATLTTVDLSNTVDETVKLVARTLPKDRAIDVRLAPPGTAVRADKTQLSQVVMNLVINAAEATEPDGHIAVTTDVRTCDGHDLDDAIVRAELTGQRCAVLTVQDDGPGMTPETLASIFQPFFTTKPRGRGLGLSTTLGIVRQHGAALSVRSAAGLGTTFVAWFPLAEPPR